MRPYNIHWRVKKRRQAALERLEKRIKVLSASKEAKDSGKLDKAIAESATLMQRIGKN